MPKPRFLGGTVLGYASREVGHFVRDWKLHVVHYQFLTQASMPKKTYLQTDREKSGKSQVVRNTSLAKQVERSYIATKNHVSFVMTLARYILSEKIEKSSMTALFSIWFLVFQAHREKKRRLATQQSMNNTSYPESETNPHTPIIKHETLSLPRQSYLKVNMRHALGNQSYMSALADRKFLRDQL